MGLGPMNTDDDQPQRSDETSPVDSHQPPFLPPEPKSMKLCRHCRREIHLEAKACHHCRFHQSLFVQYFLSYGMLAALLALGLSIFQLNEARKERVSASEAMRNAHSANERASESVTKVEAPVRQVQAAEIKVESPVAQAQTTEQHILEIEERQILRTWINILPNGEELLNPVGGGPLLKGRI
jgi:hypothetical protein